jgi:hypothetical protein
MDAAAIRSRVERLAKLSMGLGKEDSLIREGDDLLHFPERTAYRHALADVRSGTAAASTDPSPAKVYSRSLPNLPITSLTVAKSYPVLAAMCR